MKKSTAPVYRSIKIQQDDFAYKLRYSRKAKYLRLQINNDNQLEVVLPGRVSINEAEKFIREKSGWIIKHLKTSNIKEEKYLILGKEIKATQSFDFFIQKHEVSFQNSELKIISPYNSKEHIRKIYEEWLKNQAKTYIPELVNKLAEKYKFRINKIFIRGQKTRWGSCSSKNNLSFNYKLMMYRKEIIEYVIVHELCHLIEMNHSKKFWDNVDRLIPDYKILRKELKTNNI